MRVPGRFACPPNANDGALSGVGADAGANSEDVAAVVAFALLTTAASPNGVERAAATAPLDVENRVSSAKILRALLATKIHAGGQSP